MNQDDANLIAELFKEKVDLQQQIQALTQERDGLRETIQNIKRATMNTTQDDFANICDIQVICNQYLNPKL